MGVIVLDLFEEDALRELFNVGIGRAAHALSRMVDDEVHLSIPYLAIVSRTNAVTMLQERASNHVAVIRQDFEGAFDGAAFLIFPETSSLELVHSLIGEDSPLESLTELEQETLLEVGNIILNACLGSFANMMGLEFHFEIPEYFKGECDRVLDRRFLVRHKEESKAVPEEHVVFLIVDFKTGDTTPQTHSIKGFVILLLDSEAVANLKDELGKLVSPA